MSFNAIYQIAGSAMNAQTVRLNTVASNLANAESAASNPQSVYQARKPVFAAVYQNDLLTRPVGLGGARVQVLDVVTAGREAPRAGAGAGRCRRGPRGAAPLRAGPSAGGPRWLRLLPRHQHHRGDGGHDVGHPQLRD